MFSEQRPAQPDMYPVVELDTKSRATKSFGKIPGPWFTVQGWASLEDVKAGRKVGASKAKAAPVEAKAAPSPTTSRPKPMPETSGPRHAVTFKPKEMGRRGMRPGGPAAFQSGASDYAIKRHSEASGLVVRKPRPCRATAAQYHRHWHLHLRQGGLPQPWQAPVCCRSHRTG